MLTLAEIRDVVLADMPYRTGFMFLNGANFYETAHYNVCIYDVQRVPYIVFNEEGTRFTQKNVGFISQRTIGDLLLLEGMRQSGDNTPLTGFSEKAARRGNTEMLAAGLTEYIAWRHDSPMPWLTNGGRLQ